MKRKAPRVGSTKPKPLDSGQWASESTLAPKSAPPTQSGSKSASKSHTPPPVTPLLYIYRDGVDVTGKTTKAFSGQTVSLNAVVKPKKFGGSKWKWTAPDDLVKNFKVKTVNGRDTEGTRIDYDEADFTKQSISLHWVDGGSKEVIVIAKVNGKDLSASTTVDVTRPTVDLVPSKKGPQIDSGGDDLYTAFAEMTFAAMKLSHAGSLQWVQIGAFTNKITDLSGRVIEDISVNGLDGCKYPNASGGTTGDGPTILFRSDTYRTVERELEVTMYLLWKSKKPGLFVPLKSMAWRYNGILESTGAATPPAWKTVDPPRINPNFSNETPVDELSYPEWTNCFKF